LVGVVAIARRFWHGVTSVGNGGLLRTGYEGHYDSAIARTESHRRQQASCPPAGRYAEVLQLLRHRSEPAYPWLGRGPGARKELISAKHRDDPLAELTGR